MDLIKVGVQSLRMDQIEKGAMIPPITSTAVKRSSRLRTENQQKYWKDQKTVALKRSQGQDHQRKRRANSYTNAENADKKKMQI